MGSRQVISLNGVRYDAHTGERLDINQIVEPKTLPVTPVIAEPSKRHHQKAASGASVHRRQQKSSALRRNYLKTPTSKTPVQAERNRSTGHVARSSQIVRFAPHPKTIKQVNDISPATPIAPSPHMQLAMQKAHQRTIANNQQNTPRLSSSDIKHGLIQAASHNPTSSPEKKPQSMLQKSLAANTSKSSRSFMRLPQALVACLALALLGGYLTYINMPGLSVKIASAQSGVAATFPNYNPDGYRFAGPIEYSSGEVTLNFTANGGSKGYTIDQKTSGWNSVAVLDNMVADDSNGQYEIEAKNGITLYTYDNKVVWSNGGVLYTIKAEAPLSRAQLLNIATSM